MIYNGKPKICEMCQQKEATLFFKYTINGKSTNIQLCKNCAQKVDEGYVDLAHIHTSNLMQDIIENIFDNPYQIRQERKRVCKCGATEEDIVNSGKFGCSECYSTFSDLVDQYVDRLGGKTYSGKMPDHVINPKFTPPTLQSQIEELQIKLQKAKDEDDLDKAIEYKNKINELKSKL